ncbi:MAG: hypothetical protein CXR31_06120 [Geobacter sp.]|nr:MAG: hypothetical protein CXR31_06120 [Geobacter sp.]
MKAVNRISGKTLADDVSIADNLLSRMKGLLGRSTLPSGEALWIKPCMGVHTFGMKFSIDVVFLDREKHVVELAKRLRPNRMSRIYSSASSVLELPAGTIDATHTVTGDTIEIV